MYALLKIKQKLRKRESEILLFKFTFSLLIEKIYYKVK